MLGKRKAKKEAAKRDGKQWKCFQCGKNIRFNVDMLCDDCKNKRDG